MATIKTRTVQLPADHPGRRGLHTIHLADPDSGADDAGNAKRTIQVTFLHGEAKDVPENLVAMLRAGKHIS